MNGPKRLLLPTALALCLALALAAPPALAIERHVLPNGLTVLVLPQGGAPVVAVSAFVRVGRADEPPRLAGITHFVEHMMFRSTARRKGSEVERQAFAAGARFRAHTTADSTRFTVVLPSSRLKLALGFLSDSLSSARFLPAEVEEERRVVLAEAAQRRADPLLGLDADAAALAFLPYPYGARVIGSAASIRRITRADLLSWYRARYRPDRTVLVLLGDLDPTSALAEVRNAFGKWDPPGPPPPAPSPPPLTFGRYQEEAVHRPDVSPMLELTAVLPGYLDPDYMAARFLEELLGGMVRDRLVGKGLPAVATETFLTPFKVRNLLRIRVFLAHPRDAARARDILLDLFAGLRDDQVAITGVEETARNLAAREILAREDLGRLAEIIGRATLAGYYDPPGPPVALSAPDRYTRIRATDLGRIARRYLVPANLRVVYLLPDGSSSPALPPAGKVTGPGSGFTRPGPVERRPFRPIPSATGSVSGNSRRDADARVVTLSSGMKVALLEDDSLPLVGVSIVFPVGSRLDPPGREGLAFLAMQAIPRATKGYESTDLRWQFFAMGNQYSFLADRDSSRASFTVPRDDLPDALSALAQMLRHPAFTGQAIRAAKGQLLAAQSSEREQISAFSGTTFRELLFRGNGYEHPPFGTAKSVARITRSDLVRWHRRRLRLGSAYLAIVGDVSPRRAESLVMDAFDGDPGVVSPAARAHSLPAVRPPATWTRTHPSGRAYVIAGVRVPGLGSRDEPALILLARALGFRVFDEFTNRRSIAYDAGGFYDTFAGAGVFGLYAGTRPSDRVSALRFLRTELRRAGNHGLSAALVRDARGALRGDVSLADMRLATVALRIAWRGALGAGPRSFSRVEEEVSKLTPDDLRRVAHRYLAVRDLSVLDVVPEKPTR